MRNKLPLQISKSTTPLLIEAFVLSPRALIRRRQTTYIAVSLIGTAVSLHMQVRNTQTPPHVVSLIDQLYLDILVASLSIQGTDVSSLVVTHTRLRQWRYLKQILYPLQSNNAWFRVSITAGSPLRASRGGWCSSKWSRLRSEAVTRVLHIQFVKGATIFPM
jgi:hypothetical protein